MPTEQIIIGVATAIFSGGAAWAGTQIKIKSIERRLDGVERIQNTLLNRIVRLITTHNQNHGDDIDTNRIRGN